MQTLGACVMEEANLFGNNNCNVSQKYCMEMNAHVIPEKHELDFQVKMCDSMGVKWHIVGGGPPCTCTDEL